MAGVIHFPFTGFTHWGWVEHGNNLLDKNEVSKVNSFIISRSHTGTSSQVLESAFGDHVKARFDVRAAAKTLRVVLPAQKTLEP